MLTVTHYLDELAGELERALKRCTDPAARLERCIETFANYCLRYPAFLDCTLALMRGPARGLHGSVSESVWLRLGQGMARCSEHIAGTLRAGTESGAFAVEHPDYMANVLWTQILGTMHLARIRVGVREVSPGVPALFKVAPEELVRTCVASAIATVGAQSA